MLTNDVAQRCERNLLYSRSIVLNGDNGSFRIINPKPKHRIDFDGDVVSGDGLLSGDCRDDDLHVDFAEPVGELVDPGQSRLADAGQGPAPAEDEALLVLVMVFTKKWL